MISFDKEPTNRVDQLTPRILIVDEDKDVCANIREYLEAQGMEVETAHNGIQALEIATRWVPSVVLANWEMPEMEGADLAQAIKDAQQLVATYLIMMIGDEGLEQKIDAIGQGVDDYLIRPFSNEEMLVHVRLGNRINTLQTELMQMSITDPLTGLYNRRYMEHVLDNEISRAGRYGELMCCLIVECEQYSKVTETYGPYCGDAVLRYVANLLRDIVRDSDMVSRYTNVDFLILLPKTTLDDCQILIDRVKEYSDEEVFEWDGESIPLTLSIGAAEFDINDINTAEKLLAAATQNKAASKVEN